MQAVTIGRAKYGSAKVRSVNQRIPPVVRDSTGKLAIPRRPIKVDKNTGT